MAGAAFDLNAAQGMLLGLAVGDAVGTTVEFSARGSFEPVSDMIGGGPFQLEPGQWTDDTSMAICLANSLIHRQAWDPRDCMNRFVNWRDTGYASCTGSCFDIGLTTSSALNRFLRDGDPYAGSKDPASSGNGGIMRLAPAVIALPDDQDAAVACAILQSRTTHASAECLELAAGLAKILHSGELGAGGLDVQEISNRVEDQIKSSGYVRHTLEAAVWSVATTDTFGSAILRAVNLGDDADTVGAVTGQIAGRIYGINAIPTNWLSKLAWRDDLINLARRLYALPIDAPVDIPFTTPP